jgi:hypothetical protein
MVLARPNGASDVSKLKFADPMYTREETTDSLPEPDAEQLPSENVGHDNSYGKPLFWPLHVLGLAATEDCAAKQEPNGVNAHSSELPEEGSVASMFDKFGAMVGLWGNEEAKMDVKESRQTWEEKLMERCREMRAPNRQQVPRVKVEAIEEADAAYQLQVSKFKAQVMRESALPRHEPCSAIRETPSSTLPVRQGPEQLNGSPKRAAAVPFSPPVSPSTPPASSYATQLPESVLRPSKKYLDKKEESGSRHTNDWKPSPNRPFLHIPCRQEQVVGLSPPSEDHHAGVFDCGHGGPAHDPNAAGGGHLDSYRKESKLRLPRMEEVSTNTRIQTPTLPETVLQPRTLTWEATSSPSARTASQQATSGQICQRGVVVAEGNLFDVGTCIGLGSSPRFVSEPPRTVPRIQLAKSVLEQPSAASPPSASLWQTKGEVGISFPMDDQTPQSCVEEDDSNLQGDGVFHNPSSPNDRTERLVTGEVLSGQMARFKADLQELKKGHERQLDSDLCHLKENLEQARKQATSLQQVDDDLCHLRQGLERATKQDGVSAVGDPHLTVVEDAEDCNEIDIGVEGAWSACGVVPAALSRDLSCMSDRQSFLVDVEGAFSWARPSGMEEAMDADVLLSARSVDVEGAFGWAAPEVTPSSAATCLASSHAIAQRVRLESRVIATGIGVDRRESRQSGQVVASELSMVPSSHNAATSSIKLKGSSKYGKPPSQASMIAEEEATFELIGKIGVIYIYATGEVTDVQASSQASQLGVEPGWRIVRIGEAPYSRALFQEKAAMGTAYELTFSKKATSRNNQFMF